MKANLLITGGLGYIGSFTSKKIFLKKRKKTLVIDNLSRGNSFAKKYTKNNQLDISNKKVIKIYVNNKIETILYLASLTCIRESIKRKKKFWKQT